jgi:hypothetical protein
MTILGDVHLILNFIGACFVILAGVAGLVLVGGILRS